MLEYKTKAGNVWGKTEERPMYEMGYHTSTRWLCYIGLDASSDRLHGQGTYFISAESANTYLLKNKPTWAKLEDGEQ